MKSTKEQVKVCWCGSVCISTVCTQSVEYQRTRQGVLVWFCVYVYNMNTECRVPKNTSRCVGVVLCVCLQYEHRVQSTKEHVKVCWCGSVCMSTICTQSVEYQRTRQGVLVWFCVYVYNMNTECRVPKNTSRCDGVVLCVCLQYEHRVQGTDEHVMMCLHNASIALWRV